MTEIISLFAFKLYTYEVRMFKYTFYQGNAKNDAFTILIKSCLRCFSWFEIDQRIFDV